MNYTRINATLFRPVNTYEPNTPKIRERIREVLRDDGVSSEIDDVCKKLMPKYTL